MGNATDLHMRSACTLEWSCFELWQREMFGVGRKLCSSKTSSASEHFFVRFYDWSVACSSSASTRAIHTRTHRPNPLRSRISSNTRHYSNAFKPAAEPSTSSQPDAASLSPNNEPALSGHLRTLMRALPHPVVVLTSTHPSPDTGGTSPKYRGMTLSSFTTLTLTPEPIVTFNIKKPSSTLDAIRASGVFHVHVLAADKSGVDVSKVFTRGNMEEDVFKSKKFVVLKIGKDNITPPLLAAEGVLRVLRCEVLGQDEEERGVEHGKRGGLVEVGDHILVLGRVRGILVPPGKEDIDGVDGLGYADGKYRRLGDVIEAQQ